MPPPSPSSPSIELAIDSGRSTNRRAAARGRFDMPSCAFDLESAWCTSLGVPSDPVRSCAVRSESSTINFTAICARDDGNNGRRRRGRRQRIASVARPSTQSIIARHEIRRVRGSSLLERQERERLPTTLLRSARFLPRCETLSAVSFRWGDFPGTGAHPAAKGLRTKTNEFYGYRAVVISWRAHWVLVIKRWRFRVSVDDDRATP